jgi:glutamine synthetase
MANPLIEPGATHIGPRAILKQQLERLEKEQMAATIGASLDFYLFDEHEDKIATKHSPKPYLNSKRRQMLHITEKQQLFLNDIILTSKRSGLQVIAVESGEDKGQLSVYFAPTKPMELADNITFFKKAMNQMALDKELTATFMAMPDIAKTPSKLAMNILLTKNGTNFLIHKEELTKLAKGIMTTIPLQCNNPNSYKRLAVLKKKNIELTGDADALISVRVLLIVGGR